MSGDCVQSKLKPQDRRLSPLTVHAVILSNGVPHSAVNATRRGAKTFAKLDKIGAYSFQSKKQMRQVMSAFIRVQESSPCSVYDSNVILMALEVTSF